MVNISAESSAKNCIHTIKQPRKGKEPVLYIRIKDIRLLDKLDVKNIGDLVYKKIKSKFETNYLIEQNIRKYKKHGSEFIQGIKFMYAIPIIMHCRVSTPKTVKFKSKLEFNQYDITLTKEQSVLRSIIDAFEGESM